MHNCQRIRSQLRKGAVSLTLLLIATSLSSSLLNADDKAARELDNDFLVLAATQSRMVIEYSKLAADRGESEVVRAFAERLITDHTAGDKELATLLKDRGLIVSVTLTEENQAELKRLKALSGDQFDSEYMKRIVEDHEHCITAFEAQIAHGKDEGIVAHCKEQLPALREHLEEAKEISAALPE